MPLSAAFPLLITDIEKAFKEKQEAYEKSAGDRAVTAAERAAIDTKFYTALATAIHSYTMSAVVVTNGGGPVTGVAAPVPTPAGSAAVVAAAVVVTSGNLV